MGRRIVEHEQDGKEYADYGTYLLERLSIELSNEFGKSFSKRNLELIRKFYLTSKFAKTPFSQSINWTHYLHLMRITNDDERRFYEIEKEKQQLEFKRTRTQINTSLYERLALRYLMTPPMTFTPIGNII